MSIQRTTRFTWPTQLSIVLLCSICYLMAWFVNRALLSSIGWAQPDALLLTSGMQLLLVLIFAGLGAIGIGLGALLVPLLTATPADVLFIAISALMAATAPFIARRIAMDLGGMKSDLHGLNAGFLLKLSVLFALTNAVLSQAWLFWNGQITNFLEQACMTAVVSWLGCALVLSLLRLLTRKLYTWVHR